VVSDPTQTAINKAGWVEQIAKSTAQVQTLTESKNLLTQSINLYTKVSSTISNAEMVYNMIDRQVKLVTMVSTELTRKEIQSASAYAQYVKTLLSLIEVNKSNLTFLKTLISPNVKMTDGERLKFIKEMDKESKSIMSEFFSKKDRFNELDNNIRIIKSLKSKI